jgi:hypothetical protein
MKLPLAASVCIFLLALAGTASANPVGVLGLGSDGGVNATLVSFFFLPDPTSVPPGPPWDAAVNNTTTLIFAGGPLNIAEGVAINNNTPFTAGTPLPIDHFFRFAAHPNLDFELTGVAPSGASTNCALAVSNGQTCSLLINGIESPMVLEANGAGGTNASITFFGLASDTGSIGPGASTWAGSFSPTVANLTPLQIATLLCPNYLAQGNSCTAADVAAAHQVNFLSTSGSFTTSPRADAPEPGTVSMVLIGLGLLTFSQVRKRTRKA